MSRFNYFEKSGTKEKFCCDKCRVNRTRRAGNSEGIAKRRNKPEKSTNAMYDAKLRLEIAEYA